MHSPPFRSTRRRRLAGVTALALGLLGAGLSLAPSAQAAVADEYEAIDPIRVYESRAAHGLIPANATKPGENSVTKVKVTGDFTGTASDVPDTATAVSVTVTGVDSGGAENYLTVWDCEDQLDGTDGVEPDPPLASNLNLRLNDTRPNAVISRIGDNGGEGTADDFDNHICVYARNATHLLVDVTGYFPGGPTPAEELKLTSTPTRILDTRLGAQIGYQGGKPVGGQVVKATLPDAASGANSQILNVTGLDGSSNSWMTVWDCTDAKDDGAASQTNITEPDPPNVSALNLDPGVIAANLVVTNADDSPEEVCIFTSHPANIIADHIGEFPGTSSYTPKDPPIRVLETRAALGAIPAGAVKSTNNGTIALTLQGGPNNVNHVPAAADAVILNVTGTDSATGFVSVYPCQSTDDPRPTVSNLNLVAGQIRPNLVITKLSETNRICLYTQSTTHLVVDLLGYFETNAV